MDPRTRLPHKVFTIGEHVRMVGFIVGAMVLVLSLFLVVAFMLEGMRRQGASDLMMLAIFLPLALGLAWWKWKWIFREVSDPDATLPPKSGSPL